MASNRRGGTRSRSNSNPLGALIAGAVAQDPAGFLASLAAAGGQSAPKSERKRPTERRVGVLSAVEVAHLMKVVESEESSDWFHDDQNGRVSQWRLLEGEEAQKFGQFLLVRAIPTEEDKRKAQEAKAATPDPRDEKIAQLESQLSRVLTLLENQAGGSAPEAQEAQPSE